MFRKIAAVALVVGGVAAVVVPALAVGGHFEAGWLADPNATWRVVVWGKHHHLPNAPTLINYLISIGGAIAFIAGMFKCENEWPNSPLFR